MKPFYPKPLIILLTFMAGSLLQFSCKKIIPNEVQINDLKSLFSEFRQPPKEFGTVPFFVWNGEITRDEIDKYMNDFKNAGCGGVFIHPRPGLITEYLSDKWFELFKYAVDKGKQLGMDVWIYDENSYPSGFAGGHVPAEMPESYNQGQGLRLVKLQSLPDTCKNHYLCLKEENGSFKDITTNLKNETGKNGKYYLFYRTYNRNSDWYGGFSYVDLLYPGVTQKFIEITMKGYEKYAGAEFGKTVPGTFTDEPQLNSSGGIRWTPDLFEVFRKQWGYDLRTELPSLFEEVNNWKKIRHNYTQTLLHLFIERWAKPWYNYCESKGLKFTGHYWEHEWPSMRPGGDNMAMYAWHQMPAIDMLFNQFNDSSSKAQFGNVRSVKELASVANQTGRQRKLSETYGGAGWDLTFTDMKRLGDWEYVLGVNLMNQHLAPITIEGARKYDYPPTFTYHEPWWKDYKYINEHFARLSLALSSGKQINDILVLEPTTTAWLYDSYVKNNPEVTEIGQAFQSFVTRLEKSQVEYDLGSENIIKNLGSVRNGKLVVGNCSYSKIIIPPLTENLDRITFNLIKKFVSGGGRIIAFSIPTLTDGSLNNDMKVFFEKKSENISIINELTSEVISKQFLNKNLEFVTITGGRSLYHQRRTLADGQVLFLVNSSLKDSVSGELSIKGKDAIGMNTFTGEMYSYPCLQAGEKISLKFGLPPAGSLLFYISDTIQKGYTKPEMPQKLSPVQASSKISVTRNEDNAMMIDFCDIQLGNELFKDLHVYTAADKVYKYHGFKNGNPWNSAVQFKTNIVDRDTFGVKSGFTAIYHCVIQDKFEYSAIKAVIERPHLWTVTVNGSEVKPDPGIWWLDRAFGVFNIGNMIKAGENIITLKASPMKIHAEVDPVYILGDFSVEAAKKGWIIKAPDKKYTTGSWKTQGLPFYSWGVTYTKEFNIEASGGHFEVGPGNWKGTIAEISVNGKPAGLIAFPPYRLDISQSIKKGINKIDIKIIGSLKNLLGPHHNNPAPGLASPGHWKNIRSYPSGSEYQLLDYGLMDDFTLYRGI
jgi:hypothetical protein